MNPTPHLHRRPLVNYGCGYVAMENVARAFWQSRAGCSDPPELTDLRSLARDIRNATRSLPEMRVAPHACDAPGSLPDARPGSALPWRWLSFALVSRRQVSADVRSGAESAEAV